MMIISEILNCVTVNAFLKPLRPNNFTLARFFNTCTGLNDDNIQAGITPATIAVKTPNNKNQTTNWPSSCTSTGISSALNGAYCLSNVKVTYDNANENTTISNDSVINCIKICILKAPTTLHTPTSFARLSALAMERLV